MLSIRSNSLFGVTLAFTFAVVLCSIDLLLKNLIFSFLQIREVLFLAPFFNLIAVSNSGVSFGLLSGVNRFMLFAFALLVSLFFIFLSGSHWKERNFLRWFSFIMISGGALGNAFDRLFYGAVRDFLDFHLSGIHWPAFNFADILIFFGVIFMLVSDEK